MNKNNLHVNKTYGILTSVPASFIYKKEVFVAINLNRGDLEIAPAIQKGDPIDVNYR
jgi:hypothetical protein